jgi:hypothetical protein
MRSRNRGRALIAALLFISAKLCFAGTFFAPAGPWTTILSSAGHFPGTPENADIFVAPPGTPQSPEWKARLDRGAAIILEGSSPLAASLGFRAESEILSIVHPVDVHNPKLAIIWNQPIQIPRYQIPLDAKVFAEDRWASRGKSGAPLIAGVGSILWIATDPGPNGYERFPYLMQALLDLGFGPSYRSSRLWAFFDYSYRTRADPDYLAARWRKAGISALHVASWHFYDSDPARDEYVKNLIEACHRNAIVVYAWVELPHVSEKFWEDHPAWREKTAILQDAQLDWRKLMNLQNPECTAAIRAGLKQMMARFNWDGVNLAELYFESLEGAAEPARFTPMNDDVRREFRAQFGWDPVELWSSRRGDGPALRTFLDFRADLARRMQEEWLDAAVSFRKFRPDLDIVLTHVDDRFDTGMKDSIGADAARVLPLLDTLAFSFLIEDPATVWNLGPQRYPEIAKRYRALTAHPDRLAIDINIVDRYQDVYPTKQQTGTELFELVHTAAAAFPRVGLYFENSLLKPDLPLLAAASAVVTSYASVHGRISIDSPQDVELNWTLPGARVDGKPWPAISPSSLHLPPGPHVVEAGRKRDALTLIDLNAKLVSATSESAKLTFEYASDSRAVARFDRKPARLEVDGARVDIACAKDGPCPVLLPRGAHKVVAN